MALNRGLVSINDGITPNLCSFQWITQSASAELVKLDIKDAYRIIPIHPAEYHLLGIRWKENTYIDLALPFGLRSAPKLFNAIADG